MFEYESNITELTVRLQDFTSEEDLKENTPYLFFGTNKKGGQFISSGYVENKQDYVDHCCSTEPMKKEKEVTKKTIILDADMWENKPTIHKYIELAYPTIKESK